VHIHFVRLKRKMAVLLVQSIVQLQVA